MASFHAKRGWQAYVTVEREIRRKQRMKHYVATLPRTLGRLCRQIVIGGIGVLTCIACWSLAGALVGTGH